MGQALRGGTLEVKGVDGSVTREGLQEGWEPQACKDVHHPSLRRNSPCLAILGESDFVKVLDEFLTQGAGVSPHMWVGF